MKMKQSIVIIAFLTAITILSCQSNTENSTKDIEYLLNQCDKYYEQDNLDSANYYANKVLELTQGNHYAFYLKGLITLDQGNPNAAITYLDKAIKLAPDSLTYIEFKGISLSLIGDFKSAVNEFTKMIEMDSLNTIAYFNRAHTKQQLDLWESAIEDYNMAEKLDSNFQGLHYQRATSYYALKIYDKFCRDILKAYELGDERVTEELLQVCGENK